MARSCLFTHFLVHTLSAFLLTCESTLVKAAPEDHRVAGVFMLIEEGTYTMNFTAATAACLFLNVTMATRAQVEGAMQLGLETCKFGWIHEKIAVVPRLKSNNNCGKGRTGLVTWHVPESKEFGVFCFNASDIKKTPEASTAHPQTYTSSTTSTALTQTWTPTTALLKSTSRSPTRRKAPELTSVPSAFTLLLKTAPSARTSSTAPPFKPFSTRTPASRSHLITSKPSVSSFTSSALRNGTNFSVSSESVPPQSVSSANPSLGVTPTVFIVLGLVLPLLTAAAGAVWYCKLFTFWSYGQQKDDIETEMWKHNDSEMEQHSQHVEEEEEEDEERGDRKYSSEIMLCVNPNMKANASE